MLQSQNELEHFIQNNDYMMRALRAAKTCNLPDWFIGAGFIRDTVWNVQHGFKLDYSYKDLDLGYYDKTNASEVFDEELSIKLRGVFDAEWEIVNQAYAHTYNHGVAPYISATDGLAHWIETATCVAATLDDNDNVRVIAPWDIDDLLTLKLRIAPIHKGNAYYENLFHKRITSKNWLVRWPKLQIIDS